MVKTFQVTMTGSAVPIVTQPLQCKWFLFVNNAAAQIAVGDVNNQPIKLATGGTEYQGWKGPANSNLLGWYANGTNTQLLDIVYDDGTP